HSSSFPFARSAPLRDTWVKGGNPVAPLRLCRLCVCSALGALPTPPQDPLPSSANTVKLQPPIGDVAATRPMRPKHENMRLYSSAPVGGGRQENAGAPPAPENAHEPAMDRPPPGDGWL